jgi:hypothetical protein
MRIWNKGEHVFFKTKKHGVVYGEVLRKRLEYVKVGALGLGWFVWVHADRLSKIEYSQSTG